MEKKRIVFSIQSTLRFVFRVSLHTGIDRKPTHKVQPSNKLTRQFQQPPIQQPLINMQRFIFVFFLLLVSAFARRSVPQTPPRAYLPKGYPYGWGMPHPEHPEAKKEKEVKEVKRSKWFFRSVNRPTNLAQQLQSHSHALSLPLVLQLWRNPREIRPRKLCEPCAWPLWRIWLKASSKVAALAVRQLDVSLQCGDTSPPFYYYKNAFGTLQTNRGKSFHYLKSTTHSQINTSPHISSSHPFSEK